MPLYRLAEVIKDRDGNAIVQRDSRLPGFADFEPLETESLGYLAAIQDHQNEPRKAPSLRVFTGIILIVGAGILVASFAAYSEISVVRVEAKSIISAPTSVLWQIMTEVDKYPQWYSVMLEVSGTPRLCSTSTEAP